MPDQVQFRCQECGRTFDPDPDTMLESELGAEVVSEAEADEMAELGTGILAEDLAEADEDELRELGLTPAQRDALLRGESVPFGGLCICKECQDKLAAEDAR